jgi:hypothetical protein
MFKRTHEAVVDDSCKRPCKHHEIHSDEVMIGISVDGAWGVVYCEEDWTFVVPSTECFTSHVDTNEIVITVLMDQPIFDKLLVLEERLRRRSNGMVQRTNRGCLSFTVDINTAFKFINPSLGMIDKRSALTRATTVSAVLRLGTCGPPNYLWLRARTLTLG